MLTPGLALSMDLIILTHTSAVTSEGCTHLVLPLQRAVNVEGVVLEKRLQSAAERGHLERECQHSGGHERDFYHHYLAALQRDLSAFPADITGPFAMLKGGLAFFFFPFSILSVCHVDSDIILHF